MRKRLLARIALVLFVAIGSGAAYAQVDTRYQQPTADIIRMADAPPSPTTSISPDGRFMLMSERPGMPSIEDLSQPMLRLAGTRINPQTNASFITAGISKLSLLDLATNQTRNLTVPGNPKITYVSWSPDSRHLAFVQQTAGGLDLWIADVASGRSTAVAGIKLNSTTGMPLRWLPDSSGLIILSVPRLRGAAPKESVVPTGPRIQETAGEKAAVATYQDLLKNAQDVALFKYYFTSELARVDLASRRTTVIGKPSIYADVDISPSGKYIYVARVVEPYSYFVPYFSFAQELEVLDLQGNVAYKVGALALAEKIPVNGVRQGPRNVNWQPNMPNTLYYVEALDDGDPKKKVPHRDRVLSYVLPTKMAPRELLRSEHRFAGLQWAEKGDFIIWKDADRPTRKSRTFLHSLTQADARPKLVFELHTEDRYNNPGNFLITTTRQGQSVLHRSSDGQYLFLAGQGSTPQGDRPFLRRFNLNTQQTEEIFRSKDPYYETVVEVLDADAKRFITSRESVSEPPNFYLHSQGQSATKALTRFTDNQPELRSVKKQLVKYQRADGIALSGTLYLPPDYKEGERRPTFIWAYPAEFASADAASQVTGSPNRFTRVGGASHLFLVMKGYVVLDNASMPVMGGDKANDTFVDQLVMNAKAAIDKLVEMGVTDRDRIGVGGHSYGAFMTANLLAHSDLFRAGIARSGAYNRTLTPFTFQNERRTFWEVPEVYGRMSPFFHAEKVNEPILLIHGEADNNSGTFPMQSERYYAALKGLGKTARYVTLPLESHGYAARESNLHVLFEMINWMDKYVKNAPRREEARREN